MPKKGKFRVGDRVLTFRGEKGTITRVFYSFAYEIDHYPYPYQPDEVKRKLTAREIGPRRKGPR